MSYHERKSNSLDIPLTPPSPYHPYTSIPLILIASYRLLQLWDFDLVSVSSLGLTTGLWVFDVLEFYIGFLLDSFFNE
ncbi:hypothetical protein RhiirA4_484953 [Rhizophagus irregularis]|uniref:Uncharacterized protein n=1 Tax=Rhizophagus irregularis TaxID=588596 RepID=A0A2I1HPK1_9GLOM|nr:hypothetical protein RhiirA4_484953 [Rhizophagus irregularis]